MKTTTAYILNYIPRGHENAITRAQLVIASGMSDRQMRKAIQIARDDGALILNAQDGSGYFVATESDLAELLLQYRQDTARALSLLKRRRHMHRILRAAGAI